LVLQRHGPVKHLLNSGAQDDAGLPAEERGECDLCMVMYQNVERYNVYGSEKPVVCRPGIITGKGAIMRWLP
jgi:hypothetical protein